MKDESKKVSGSQLDPRAVVVLIKDYEKRIDIIKAKVAIMLSSLHDAGKITRELKEYLTNKVNEM